MGWQWRCRCTEVQMCMRRELNVLTKVIQNISSGSEPERDSQPLSFSMKGMVFFLAFFSPFFILCLRSSPGLPYPNRHSSTKPPQSALLLPFFSGNCNSPSPGVSKLSLSHRFLCLSSFFSPVREAFLDASWCTGLIVNLPQLSLKKRHWLLTPCQQNFIHLRVRLWLELQPFQQATLYLVHMFLITQPFFSQVFYH